MYQMVLKKYGNAIILDIEHERGIATVVGVTRAVQPIDAEIDLPTLPSRYEPTNQDIQRAVNSFDARTDYPGLLDSEVVNE